MGFRDRVKNAWNAFLGRDPTKHVSEVGGSYYRPGRLRLSYGNNRSMITSVLNRIAVDVASIDVKHIRVDENGRYKEEMDSYLNDCLTLDANLDQTARAFMEDVTFTMLDEGTVAIVPTDTTVNPIRSGGFDVLSLRVGKVVTWYPESVKVNLYNERTGKREDITLPKSMVALVENPFYQIMNEPNSFYQRLLSKLKMLDQLDSQSASGKLDLIIQLPYVIKTEARREQAENRRKDIEMQLSGSKYGIAYTDGTEKITQLNRSVENNLLTQIEYYMKQWQSQLGLPETVFNGTADEATMLNYNNRTLEPIVSAITDEMTRKFLTKTARTQGQRIKSFKDPFKLVPVNQIAEIADKFTRNEILTSNEVRQIMGFKPADDPKADKLINANMPQEDQGMMDPSMMENPEAMEGVGAEEAPEASAGGAGGAAPPQIDLSKLLKIPVDQIQVSG